MNIVVFRFIYYMVVSVVIFGMHSVSGMTVYNESNRSIYVAFYYVKETLFGGASTNQRATSIVEIQSDQHAQVPYPTITITEKRELMFTDVPTELKDTLSWEEYQYIGKKRMSTFNVYYIAEKDSRLKAYTLTEWKLLRPVKQIRQEVTGGLTAPMIEQIKQDQPAVRENQYAQTNVSVRVSKELDSQEVAYRSQRKPKIKVALEKLLGKSLDNRYVPEIAIVLSGGGHRAALYGVAALGIAQEKGLFDATMYITTLSGATWGLTYTAFESIRRPRPISQIATDLVNVLSKPFGVLSSSDSKELGSALLVKAAFNQPVNNVDLFGLVLGNQLFDQYKYEKHRIYLSEQKQLLIDGNWPLPIYTAVPAETATLEKLTYEFTPFEVWAPWGMSVPPYAFGDKFVNGVRIKSGDMFAPEQPMDILLGTFGSAYTFTVKRAYEEVENMLPLVLKSIIHQAPKEITEARFTAAEFFNFTVGMSGSPIKNNKKMLMGDAGLGVTGGLGFQPVSSDFNRRNPDMYIIVDISEIITDGFDLRKVENYMRSQGRKFPKVPDYKDIHKKTITVFKDETDPTVPVVVYMPRSNEQEVWEQYKNQPEFRRYSRSLDTFNIQKCVDSRDCWALAMHYEQALAEQIVALGAFNMHASMTAIVDAINWVIEHKK